MAFFDVAALEGLEYDFTGIPKGDGKGFCTGRGVIPEPTEELMNGFLKAIAESAGVTGEDNGQATAAAAARAGASGTVTAAELSEIRAVLDDPSKSRRDLTVHLVKLTQGTPDKKQIDELPPRYFNGFFNKLVNEVGNPTLANNATPA